MITESVLLKVNPLPETRLNSGFSEDQDLTREGEGDLGAFSARK